MSLSGRMQITPLYANAMCVIPTVCSVHVTGLPEYAFQESQTDFPNLIKILEI